MESNSAKKYKIAIIGSTGAIGKVFLRWAMKDDRISELTILARKKLDEWD